ncbi:MAG TPA: HAD family hydrolase [Candidatus Acidoferrum sp.]|nr:HAD family hydrolase [Candidatus Acidoferrum sp.]
MQRLVLIDVNNLIVKDQKDVSEYVFEAIRSRYGFEPSFKLSEYEGVPAQLMVRDILEKNEVSQDEIALRLEGTAEELGYSYYNVTGREAITVLEGARQFLEELSKRGAVVGIATGDIEDIIKNKLQRANLAEHFKFGEYGNKENDLTRLIQKAERRASAEFGLEAGSSVWIVASSPQIIKASAAAGAKAVGVASGGYSKEALKEAGAEEVIESLRERSRAIKAIFR